MSKVLVTLFAYFCVAAAIVAFWPVVKSNAATFGSVSFEYDSLGRIVQDVYPANSGGYNYDNAGNRTAATQN